MRAPTNLSVRVLGRLVLRLPQNEQKQKQEQHPHHVGVPLLRVQGTVVPFHVGDRRVHVESLNG